MANDERPGDRALGMDRAITRRDILHGGALGLGASLLPGGDAAAQATGTAIDPPFRTGLRGSHPGSFEIAHALRDGRLDTAARDLSADEHYDLVVVGGGISGLSTALFYRDRQPDARILILENHDDFGGHARRNAFRRGGRIALANGGTAGIESPRPYSAVADGLLNRLGIDVPALAKACPEATTFADRGMTRGTFFDRETFGADKLVRGLGTRPWAEALAEAPLSDAVRHDILRIETGHEDYLPGLSSAVKKARLSRISYARYLTEIVRADPGVLPYYQQRPQGWWGVGIDALSALDLWAMKYPGFDGLGLEPGAIPHMGFTPAGFADTGGSAEFHFPDGNATIARMLVRALIPPALAAGDVAGTMLAEVDYSALDRPGQPVRLRLSSTVLRAANIAPGGVELVYAQGGRFRKVAARHCVMAGWNMMIPYLVPELPDAQKAALHSLVKVPLVYVSVSLTNWRAFDRLGVSRLSFPGGYYQTGQLDATGPIGDYRGPRVPDDPALLLLSKVPCRPGLSEHDQCRAGRAELLATPLATYERQLRDLLGRALAGGGFDPANDIDAITVNRWPHGYAPEYNPLWDAETAADDAPNVIGRQRCGAIAIANADAGRAAYTDIAIDQAHRAVGELLA